MSDNKKARNLSVLSFAVILYVLGGASFAESGSLFGGSVKFARPYVLEWAGLALLAFYFYRFLLESHPLSNVSRVKEQYLRTNSAFMTYISTIGTAEMERNLRESGTVGGMKFEEGSQNYPVKIHWQSLDGPHIMTRRWFKRIAKVAALNERNSIQTTFDVQLSWWVCARLEIIAELKAIFLNDAFWEDIFPMILCCVAFGLVFARRIGVV